MMTDPIADMLTRLRNAVAVRKPEIDIPYSKLKYAIAALLEREGYLSKVSVAENKLSFRIYPRYNVGGQSSFQSVQRVSKPGRRVYVAHDKIPTVLNGFGIAILSTSRGVMTGKEARKHGLGGELLCTIA